MRKAGKPLRPGDIAKMAGLESREASRIIRELRKKGLVYSPKRCYYAPTTLFSETSTSCRCRFDW